MAKIWQHLQMLSTETNTYGIFTRIIPPSKWDNSPLGGNSPRLKTTVLNHRAWTIGYYCWFVETFCFVLLVNDQFHSLERNGTFLGNMYRRTSMQIKIQWKSDVPIILTTESLKRHICSALIQICGYLMSKRVWTWTITVRAIVWYSVWLLFVHMIFVWCN